MVKVVAFGNHLGHPVEQAEGRRTGEDDDSTGGWTDDEAAGAPHWRPGLRGSGGPRPLGTALFGSIWWL